MTGNQAAEQHAQTSTLRIHRFIGAPPERVYRAFLDPDAMVKWLPPHGFTAHVDHMDATVGGTYRMSFTNFSNGGTHSFGGKYLRLEPSSLIEYTDAFEDPGLPGTMTTTITFKEALTGTEVHIQQTGLPAAMPVEFAYTGWQQSLELLERLVGPDIPAETGPKDD